MWVGALTLTAACGGSSTGGAGGAAGSGGAGGAAGAGGTAGLAACGRTSECVVVPESCCGTCGMATAGDAIAVAAAKANEHRTAACAGQGGGGCPLCAGQEDPTLLATCRSGECALVVLTTDPITECSASTDCRLRTSDCCECGGDTSVAGLIAVRADSESTYAEMACDDGQGCPECAPQYPAEASAQCLVGRCTVVYQGGG